MSSKLIKLETANRLNWWFEIFNADWWSLFSHSSDRWALWLRTWSLAQGATSSSLDTRTVTLWCGAHRRWICSTLCRYAATLHAEKRMENFDFWLIVWFCFDRFFSDLIASQWVGSAQVSCLGPVDQGRQWAAAEWRYGRQGIHSLCLTLRFTVPMCRILAWTWLSIAIYLSLLHDVWLRLSICAMYY